MKAIRVYQFGAPDVMKFEDVSDPQTGSGQVLVRLHAVGVNPLDAYVRAGTYAMKPDLPYVPGSDGAGVIEAVVEDLVSSATIRSAARSSRRWRTNVVTTASAHTISPS